MNLLILTVSLFFGSAIAQPVDITSLEHQHGSNTSTWIKVKDKPGNAQDWVGIYPVGASSAWGNVVDWSWANETSEANDPGDWYKFTLPDGNYEARFFLNNTYTIEDSTPFIVGDVVSVNTLKLVYGVNEDIGVNVANISGNQDWVGIYPKGTSNSWGNVKTWVWATQNGNLNITGVKAGEYEARLFFKNSFNVESKVVFNVSDEIQATLSISKENFHENEIVNVTVSNLSGDQDWVGVYPKNSDNSWGNVVAWNWVTGDGSFELSRIKKDMPAGEYEARLFFRNSYNMESKSGFSVIGDYGEMGNLATAITEYNDGGAEPLIIYHPVNWNVQKTPVVYFSPGFSNKIEHEKYGTFFRFIASHGYSVIFVPQYRISSHDFGRFVDAVEAHAENFDSTRMGTIGHSTGGGMVFNILELMIKKGYGSEGRFLFTMDAWSPYHMKHEEMQLLKDTNIVIMQFGKTGNVTDARIPLVIYSDLIGTGIDKNYIVLTDVPGAEDTEVGRNEQHGFPYNLKKINNAWVEIPDYMETRKSLLKPLEALMAYTFKEPLDTHRKIALEGEGKVNPYETGYQKVLNEYLRSDSKYGCEIAYNNHINYCGIPRIPEN